MAAATIDPERRLRRTWGSRATTAARIRSPARHNRRLDGPVRSHHLHLYLVDDAVEEAQRWYAATFGGVPGMRWRYDAVDLPGINFNFSFNADAGGAPTAGRMLDHIGFEVEDLERFCRALEARVWRWTSPTAGIPTGSGTRS